MTGIAALVRRLPPPLRAAVERALEAPDGSRLARGVYWSLVGLVASRGLALVANVIAARLLGRPGLGELDMVLNTVSFAGVFAGMGVGTAATRQVAQMRAAQPARAGRVIAYATILALVAGTLMAVALALAAPWLARSVLAAPHLAPALRHASPLLLLGALAGAQQGSLAGFESFKATAAAGAVAAVVYLPLMVLGVSAAGLDGAVAASVASLAVTVTLNQVALGRRAAREGTRIQAGGCLAEGPAVLAIAVPALCSALLVAPVEWAARTLLVHGPGGYAELGAYNVGNQWYGVVMFIPMVLAQPLLPVLSEAWTRNGAAECRRTLVLAMRVNAFVVLPIVLAGCLASPLIVRIYGPAFEGAWPPLALMLVTAGAVAVQWPIGVFLTAAGRLWYGTAMNVCWAALYLGLTWLLADRGAAGLAGARLAAYAMLLLWSFAVLARVPSAAAKGT